MEKGSPPADLPLLALTLVRPVAQAVVRIGWPLPTPYATGPCLLAIHASQQYDYAAARRIEHQSGHTMPSRQQATVGVIGVGRWDGARLLDVQAIEPIYCKGRPGLWALDETIAEEVLRRYQAGPSGPEPRLARQRRSPLGIANQSEPSLSMPAREEQEVQTLRPDFPWGDT